MNNTFPVNNGQRAVSVVKATVTIHGGQNRGNEMVRKWKGESGNREKNSMSSLAAEQRCRYQDLGIDWQ